jgi:hypothetical protein
MGYGAGEVPSSADAIISDSRLFSTPESDIIPDGPLPGGMGKDIVNAVDGVNAFLASASESIGTPEAGLRLLISLFLGYPIAVFHRFLVSDLQTAACYLITN